jgi:hypothetical protein
LFKKSNAKDLLKDFKATSKDGPFIDNKLFTSELDLNDNKERIISIQNSTDYKLIKLRKLFS